MNIRIRRNCKMHERTHVALIEADSSSFYMARSNELCVDLICHTINNNAVIIIFKTAKTPTYT